MAEMKQSLVAIVYSAITILQTVLALHPLFSLSSASRTGVPWQSDVVLTANCELFKINSSTHKEAHMGPVACRFSRLARTVATGAVAHKGWT